MPFVDGPVRSDRRGREVWCGRVEGLWPLEGGRKPASIRRDILSAAVSTRLLDEAVGEEDEEAGRVVERRAADCGRDGASHNDRRFRRAGVGGCDGAAADPAAAGEEVVCPIERALNEGGGGGRGRIERRESEK